MARFIMALSGGLDSAVLLAKLVAEGHEVTCVNFQYGSKHNPHEMGAFHKLVGHYKVPGHLISLGQLLGATSALTDPNTPVPEGHYEEDTMKQTVVPGRNLLFLSLLAGIAERDGHEHVAIGVHAGDHHIYPDCRPRFVDAVSQTIDASTNGKVTVLAPFMFINKAQVVLIGKKYAVPFELTRTCYGSDPVACGRCGSCQERLEAFARHGWVDPLGYQTRVLLPKRS